MITVRRAEERGHANHGWLDTYHTFSFADYYDPAHMGYRSLRVMNDDRVAASQGFGMHGHRDMEIITYVLDGQLAHRDSLGNGSILTPGRFQRMTAGRGIRHSEFNPSDSEPLHLYQIWIEPNQMGLEPSYEERTYANEEKQGRLRLVASPDGGHDSMAIHQDARVYLAALDRGQSVTHRLAEGRGAWVQALEGSFMVNGQRLNTGDGAQIEQETELRIEANEPGEVLVFDLA